MTKHFRKTSGGFLLIEVLVAVLIVAMGVLGLAKLEAMVIGASGEAKSRSAAMALARSQIDTLRNSVLQTQYTANLASGSRTDTINGIAFTTAWTVTQPDVNFNDRLVQVAVSWLDRSGTTQSLTLNSVVAWNDPVMGQFTTNSTNTNVIAPTGAAKRGTGAYTPGQSVTVATGDDNVTRLLNASGETILYLEPVDGVAQQFTIIYGRVHFDQTVTANSLPSSAKVFVRLSSEGECIYDHAAGNLVSLPDGATGNDLKYKYFAYRCFVGPGWYGNVGVTVINDSTTPTICVGDPKFTDTSFTATPVATESTIRSYRGFRASTSGGVTTYISTGVAGDSIYGDDGSGVTAKSGKPIPSDYLGVYGIALGSTSDFFKQDFLVTKIQGQMSCSGQMALISIDTPFPPNAGKYYCINPDNWSADENGNQCPTNWFGSAANCSIAVSGSFNAPVPPAAGSTTTSSVTCTMSDGSACSCQTTSGTSNYSCSMAAASSQTATITASMTAASWSIPTQLTCIPTASCTAPSNSSTTQYQCAQSTCSSGQMKTQSRTITAASWADTACVPAASCVAPSNTSTKQYQCVQSGCASGELIIQTRTKTGGSWGAWADDTPSCSNSCSASSGYAIDSSNSVEYQCATSSCTGGKQIPQHRTVAYGGWADTSATCVSTSATKPDDTASIQYTWLAGDGANGCASGTQQLQSQTFSSSTTQTCTRTSSALNCASVSSFNIDSATATCQ